MAVQTEAQLEEELMVQLQGLGFERVTIPDEAALVQNLRRQLETHNGTRLSDPEFRQVLNQLSKGDIFAKAKTLRDRVLVTRDDGSPLHLRLLNIEQWCKNEFQVTNQITIEGTYTNRYDVTLLINGLPLVQIELKRRGLEMKEAFNQFGRYDKFSFGAGHGLFNFLQICIISNGVNTKYFANAPVGKRDFKQTFYWTDENNFKISLLSDFAEAFLEKCQLSKMITKYVVLNESGRFLMALRPYQYYATEAIVKRVEDTTKNGYIWHTTGSGKTLTSFKTAQILTQSPKVHKVVFVVDRKDLDYQTIEEFNSFRPGSVDATNNTSKLVEQFGDGTVKLIVTTLQKLNTAISSERHKARMVGLRDERMVFIFDECHRSQFGDTHQRITGFFRQTQLFGFTGTPIFAENAGAAHSYVAHDGAVVKRKRTTADLFGDCLHKYVITDAIADENVLRFSIEYFSTFRGKDYVADADVEGINTSEVWDAPERLESIVDKIISIHDLKTHEREFTAMFCVSSTDALIAYYDLFRAKKEAGEHNLQIGTIFSYVANQELDDPSGDLDADIPVDGSVGVGKAHHRERLEEFISEYNEAFTENFSTNNFYGYYQDIGKKTKARKIDILLVVNMFLTGFDSKPLNTIYVDKNLRYHGLLQAFSRTNRILGAKKSQGNVVCFRNLRANTNKAIELFANKDAQDTILLAPYEDYLAQIEASIGDLRLITPTVADVDRLLTEEEEAQFVQAFRAIMRLKNVLESFSQFSFDALSMDEQEFNDFASKYQDLRDKVKGDQDPDKVSILADIDFEIELITRDKINVTYIISLLAELVDGEASDEPKRRKQVADLLKSEHQLRSKRELIERFIAEHVPELGQGADVGGAFEDFWTEEKAKALKTIAEDEGLRAGGLSEAVDRYLYSGRLPIRDDMLGLLHERPRLSDRKPIAQRLLDKMTGFIDTFIEGMG